MSDTSIITLYDAPGIFRSWYDPSLNAFVCKVYNLNLGSHRYSAFQIHIAAMQKYKFETMVFDTEDAIGHHQPDDMQWIVNTAMPAYKKQNIKTMVFIFPNNFIAKVAAKSWLEIANEFGFKFIQCKSLDEVNNVLLQ